MQFPPSSHSLHDFHMFLLHTVCVGGVGSGGGAATDEERSLHSGNPFTHILPHTGEIPEESGRVPALLVFALPNELEGVGGWGV